MRSGIALGLVAAIALLAWALWPDSDERQRSEVSREAPEESGSSISDPKIEPDRANEALAPIDLDAADRKRDLHGIVVRKSDGQPIAGALVSVISEPWRPFSLSGDALDSVRESGPTARSASDGTFAIPLGVARRYSLRAEKDGFAPTEWRYLRRGARVRLELQAGREFAVRVVDQDKVPAKEARVRLTFFDLDLRTTLPMEGTTDEAGEAAWPNVPPLERVEIRIEHSELGFLYTSRPFPEQLPLVIEMPPGRTLRGLVLDAETRRPIAGARVGPWPRLDGAVSTDASGWFALPGWTGTPRDLLGAEAEGYAIGGVRVAESEEVEVTLSRGGVVTGRIVDSAGRPVESARCILTGDVRFGRDSLHQQRRCVSDVDGRIHFEGVCVPTSPLFREQMLHVFADGHARLFHRFDANFRERPLDLGDLALAEPHALTIRLTRGDAPAIGIRSWLVGPLAEGERFTGGVPQPIGISDEAGLVRYEGLAPGRYRFNIRIDGAPGFQEEVVVSEREQTWDVELAVGRELKITVVDEAGEPVHQYLRVTASHDGNHLSSRVEPDGTATILIWPEAREIQLRDYRNRDPRKWRSFPIEEGQTELRIVHSTKIPTTGVVVTADGTPLDRARIRASRGGEWLGDTESNNKGEFMLHAKAGDPCRIEALGTAPDGRKFVLGVAENVAIGATDLRIVVREPPRDRKLHIRALAPDGTPLAGVSVGSINNQAMTDAAGIATIEGQVPMAAEMGGFDPECRYAHPARVVAVPDGQTIEVRFREGSPVRLRILENGEPLADVQCFVYGESARIHCRTSDEGWIRFAVLKGANEKFNLSVHTNRKQYNQIGIGAANDGESFDIKKMTYR